MKNDFLQLKFGMFIHFGLYSNGEDTEWHMYTHKMSLPKYKAQFLHQFDPDPEGIEQWVKVAKSMGAKYLVCTSKHCDGFCLWDSKYRHPLDPEYHITNTPFFKKHNKSVLDYLFEAGRKHGIKIGLYYAVLDWSWTKKKPFRPPAHRITNPEHLSQFITHTQNQLVELLQKYPDTLLFWLDGHVFYANGFEVLHHQELYESLHQQKADILVGSNLATTTEDKQISHVDFLIYENMAFRGEMNPVVWPRKDPDQLPAEVCLTLNNHWGYNAQDKHFKDPRKIAKLIQENHQRRGNTLLNFGPTGKGFIPEEQIPMAEQIGQYLENSNTTK